MSRRPTVAMSKKHAFITGGSSDIGLAITKCLVAAGWEVVAPSHKELDLSDLKAVAGYGQKLRRSAFNAVIHAAGIWHNQNEVLAGKGIGAFTPDDISATLNVGLTSFMLLIAALQPPNGDVIIGISGTFESGGRGWLPYYTSKRALEDFLVGLSQETAGQKVYGISPSDTATAAYAKFLPQYLGEAQPPEVIADLVMKLVSGDHAYKSGDIIMVKQSREHVEFHA